MAGATAGHHIETQTQDGIRRQANPVKIDDKKFEASLDKFLPRPLNNCRPIRKRLRDAQFRQLADFCNRAGHPQWGLRPRTFAVLRMIGYPEIIEAFIKEKLTDIFLPYTENNLPAFINGQARKNFLDCQNYVLSGHASALEKPGEPHQNVEGSADEYFLYLEDLGAGGFGEVDSVIGQMSLMKFARKRIKRHRLYSRDKASLQIFENELQTLKSLSHRHLVQLVGSYTDSSCVGLIMTPVADMNLATYLRATEKPESRKACLRRFFGCLTTALSYLHDKHIQHKDIKPANILVKEQKVYLTDFGTSKSWDNETPKTTQGTVLLLTPRYCAPEVVQFGSSRNESRDIWSLGCVFFEMCSVLANRTVEEMVEFFKDSGTKGEYIRENQAATMAWAESLRSTFALPQDQFPLELAISMCNLDSRKRPLAKEILARIFDLDSTPRYYGLCCDEQSHCNDRQVGQTSDKSCEIWDSGFKGVGAGVSEQQINHMEPRTPRYQPPTVDDPTSDMITQAFFPPGGLARQHVLEDAEEPDKASDDSRDHGNSAIPVAEVTEALPPQQPMKARATEEHNFFASSIQAQSRSTSSKQHNVGSAITFIVENLDRSKLKCPWPVCQDESKFFNEESLSAHLRDGHGTHELFWSSLICRRANDETNRTSSPWMPGQIISESMKNKNVSTESAFVLKRDVKNLVTTFDSFATRLRDQCNDRKRRRARAEAWPSFPGAKAAPKPSFDCPVREHDTSDGILVDNPPFALLPKDCRPEPLQSALDEENLNSQDDPILSPDPIPEPFISLDAAKNSTQWTVPKSTLVPSYFLASANRLSSDQVDFGPPPLFVYGSLMFPSILRARAARFVSAEGVYSSELQRRIPTSAEDWSWVNESLQHAAQQMTPALLKGFERIELRKSRDAGLTMSKATNEIRGFIVSGLSYEAFACLDYLYGPEGSKEDPKKRKERQNSGAASDQSTDWSDSDSSAYSRTSSKIQVNFLDLFVRKKIDVTICAPNGQPRRLAAQTYVWKIGPSSGSELWNINRFVKCKSLRQYSTNPQLPKYDWVGEETRLANKMGMMYAMPGDELCDKILNGNIDIVEALVEEGSDVNAPCHLYGTPLQAAAAKGDEEMVYVMMKYLKADPNIEAGKYRFPLIAAISEGHEEVVRTLLRYGANPLIEAGPFISPIYQAVSFEDVKMTEMLLEKGAWLCKDYQELLDLATESRNHEIWGLLQEYDIRDLHKRLRLKAENRLSGSNLRPNPDQRKVGEWDYRLIPTLMEILRLKGRKGKWTGIKAVKVIRIAYGDEVPERLLAFMSQNLELIQKTVTDLLTGGDHERALLKDRQESRLPLSENPKAERDNAQENVRSITKTGFDLNSPLRRAQPDASQQQPRRQAETDEELLCLTCDNRGGRKGTGRMCPDCRGNGQIERPLARSRAERGYWKKCRACNGVGNIFSERDRCRACNEPKPPFRESPQERGKVKNTAELESETRRRRVPWDDPVSDLPPPYPGR